MNTRTTPELPPDSDRAEPPVMNRWVLLAAPVLIVALVLCAAWPGYLSFDSAFQWQQARSGSFADIAPPMLPWLWSLLLRLGLPDTSGPLLLIGGLHAFGFARLALLALERGQVRLAWVLALAGPCCPLLLLLLAQIWTDLLLSGALLSAVAVLAGGPRSRLAHLGLLVLLVMACGARHNGILAVLPLIGWWVLRGGEHAALAAMPDRSPSALRSMTTLRFTLLVLLVWSLPKLLATSLGISKLDTWAVTPLFDLQAVSVATGQQRLPGSVVGEGMDVTQLRAAFHPYSATRLFEGTRSGVSNPTVAPLRPEQRADLLKAWRSLPLEAAWWSHRWRLFRGLLGSHRGPLLKGLADSPMLLPHADNPPLQRAHPLLHQHYRELLDRLRDSWLYAPGLYLLLGSGVAVVWLVRRRSLSRGTPVSTWALPTEITVLLFSAWLYTLPYLVLAPSAETRYLLWPALACWLVFLHVVANHRPRKTN